ncbi:histone H4 type VIII-like [Clarias gariepinus]
MSGKGNGDKGLGRRGGKRYRKVHCDDFQEITNSAVDLVYEETRSVMKDFLEIVIRDAVTYTEQAKRKTVTALDVIYALKKQEHLLGFNR